MLRCLTLLLSVCLCLSGCGSKPAPAPAQQLTLPFSQMVDTLVDDYGLPMPAALDDELAEGLLGLSPDDYRECSGYLSLSGDSPDHLVAVEAAPGCAEQVAKALERRREFLLEAYRDQPQQYSRVQAGTVVFHGEYVFLVIAGRPGADPLAEVAEITKKLEDNFVK